MIQFHVTPLVSNVTNVEMIPHAIEDFGSQYLLQFVNP